MEHGEQENGTAAATLTNSPASELESKPATLPSAPAETWEERIDDSTSVLWTCRDPRTRKVVKVISCISLVRKQKAAGIPKSYRLARLDSWDAGRSNLYVADVVRCYVHKPENSLFLSGPVGIGKTWAMVCIGNELLEKGHSVKFQSVSALLLAIRDSFACQDTSELQILQPFFDVQYLLLDELGDLCLDGDRTASSFAASRILALLDKRFQNGGKTVITSNLSLEKLTSWTGDERIGSRIRGLCGEQGIVELEGRDLRFDSVPEEAESNKGR